LFIGLMSGTSVDSIDAVLVEFLDGKPHLLAGRAEPVPADLRRELLALTRPGPDEISRMGRADGSVARLFAHTVGSLLNAAGVTPDRIRAIGSHGQTIRHEPEGPEPYTMQIGNPSLIAELTSITTVADFRRRDMAAGGQAAPLAPGFHAAFLRSADENRVVVNIGGIANVTLLPKDPSQPVTGFDTGPGNALLDSWAQRHRNMTMDAGGVWAAGGRVIPELFDRLSADTYFSLPAPKSTGREYFHLDWLDRALRQSPTPTDPRDVQTTLAALTVRTITQAIRHYAPETQCALICGGGVHNPTLMTGLQRELDPLPVESTAAHGIDPDYMEAMGFAWLAQRALNGLPGNLPEVTGARGPRILGAIYPA
jgi:anhydro-N-acetylmuramic acid kinase